MLSPHSVSLCLHCSGEFRLCALVTAGWYAKRLKPGSRSVIQSHSNHTPEPKDLACLSALAKAKEYLIKY